MIGDYKGEVKNKVVTALLQSYQDVLDYDGLKSILREAEMLYLKDLKDLDPNKILDFFSFKKIIAAQNILLYDSNDLLFQIGRKFAFYLFPFGKNFEDVIKDINEYIKTDWKVEIFEISERNVAIKVQNCIFCSSTGVSCNLFKGFLFNSLEKSLPANRRIVMVNQVENVRDPNHNNFILRLKIKKNNYI